MTTSCLNSMRRFVLAAFFVSICSALAFAQSAGTGTITGTVTDPQGSTVPGAIVTVRNTDTGGERTLTTNDAGIYVAAFLQSGNYQVKASKQGFAVVEHKGLVLAVGQTLTIDFAMPLKTTEETVTVTSQAPLIEPEKTETSQAVSQTLVENLPINGRRWDNFVLLTPGVTTDGGFGLVSYRGISGLYNGNYVDGANNNQAFFSEARGRTRIQYTYSMDAIKEFQVSESNYSAEFGQAAGGIVNAVTKSGQNTIHGDVFYYLRYPALNALDPIAKSRGIFTQSDHQRQQFGGSAGGPIIKDKFFYFFNYDGSRRVFPIVYTGPSAAPGTLAPANCPVQATAAQCTAAINFVNSLTGIFPRNGNQDVYLGKLDYQLNDKNRFSAAFNFHNWRSPNGVITSTTRFNDSSTTNGGDFVHSRYLIADWNSTVTSHMLNDFRFQWGRDLEVETPNFPGPSVSISGITTYGEPNFLPRTAFPDEHRYQLTDNLSIVRGRHTFKTGVDVNLIHELLINLFQGDGVYSYSGASAGAFRNWVADVYGLNLGDGRTGRHYSNFTQAVDPITGVGKDDFYNNDIATYFEDSWKARSNLTVNLGLRYEIQHIPQPPRPNTATPLLASFTTTINTDTNNFGPRIGVSWEFMKNTVLRAGYGIFYGKTTNSTFYTVRVENGVFQQTGVCGPTSGCAPNFPNVIFPAPGPALQAPFSGALTPAVQTVAVSPSSSLSRGLAPDFVNPLVHEGELAIERQIPGNISVSASYLFSRGLHLPVFIDTNLNPTALTKTYDVTDASGNTVSQVTVPLYTSRPSPASGIVLTGFSGVSSWYHGLILSARKPLSHGVEILGNYTFSKSIDTGQVIGTNGTFNGTNTPLDPFNQRGEHALSDLDQRHRFVGSVYWVPPFKKISNRPLRLLVDGFSFSTITTIASPQPVTATISGSPCPNGMDFGVTCGEVSSFGGFTGGRAPNVGRNAFHGATQFRDVDFRVTREIPLRERFKLQVLAEAFNLFNHTNFQSVSSTLLDVAQPSALATATCKAAVHVNTCLVPDSTPFLIPQSASNTLYGARQLQFSAKISF
ncbi:MAG TPA: TonB-dependent receptor [Candidatus Acidoferrales bacterium]|nr:TonB-dependent receptor [Candidatus Acidoferrales bacterium]